MKKNKKGFTLIELIVVMAILTILMTAIFTMFNPVSKFYVNAADTDKRYSAIHGINNYIIDNVKFAKGVYVFANVDNIDTIKLKKSDGTGYEYIYQRFLKDSGFDPTLSTDRDKINIIALYEDTAKTDTWSDGTSCKGRVYKVRGIDNSSYSVGKYFDNEYQALGKGYYGKYNYDFSMTGTLNYDTTPTTVSSNNSELVINTEMSDSSSKITDITSRIQYLNVGKSGAGSFYYFDPTTTPQTTPIDVQGTLPAGNNIFIMYVMP